MKPRTPPSLKWLIVKRSCLAGALEKTDEDISYAREDLARLASTRAVIAKRQDAIDVAMGIHEIRLNRQDLASVVPQQRDWLLPRGNLSRVIRGTLRERSIWPTTNQLVRVVAKEIEKIGELVDAPFVAREIRRWLRGLLKLGNVIRYLSLNERCHSDGVSMALWSLPEQNQPIDDTRCRRSGSGAELLQAVVANYARALATRGHGAGIGNGKGYLLVRRSLHLSLRRARRFESRLSRDGLQQQAKNSYFHTA